MNALAKDASLHETDAYTPFSKRVTTADVLLVGAVWLIVLARLAAGSLM